jgi:hypothetical protein
MGVAVYFLLCHVVQSDLFTFGPGLTHLRQKPPDVTSNFRVSFPFEQIVNGIPALLDLATGCDKLRLTRLRLSAITTNIFIEFLLNVGGPLPRVRPKNAICLCNSCLAAHRALGRVRGDTQIVSSPRTVAANREASLSGYSAAGLARSSP